MCMQLCVCVWHWIGWGGIRPVLIAWFVAFDPLSRNSKLGRYGRWRGLLFSMAQEMMSDED